ncbi:MAG: hypothetical protein HQL07_04300 [Nitrospirae bacterium]|nr:hypothetical protein [Magnetococcales bacterium]HAT51435.1 hypothetical protein [Alphaproteobacteria bacterium]
MTVWNLLVILCFFVIYLGIAVIFRQLRGIREEMVRLTREVASRGQDTDDDDGNDRNDRAIFELRSRLQQLGTEMLEAMEALPKVMRNDLDGIVGEIRMLQRSIGPMGMNMGMGVGMGGVRDAKDEESFKANAYHEARLLLANGVDEDRVIAETGLTVEEVSLLKRMGSKVTEEV